MNKKISKKLIAILFICIGFAFGFLINQKINEKVFYKLFTHDNLNFSLLLEAWNNINENFVFEDKIDTEKMMYGAVHGFISALDDPYTSFFDPDEAEKFQEDLEGSFEGIGIQITKRDNQIKIISPIKNTPAEKIGILAGDTIEKINSENISSLDLDTIVQKIRGEKGTTVTLSIIRDSKKLTFAIKRDTIKVPNCELEFIESDKIALLSIFQFSETTSRDVEKEVTAILNKGNIKGIILDLRNNPGGLVHEAKNVASLFLKKDLPIVKECDKNNECFWLKSNGPGKLADIPIVILINKGTASAAEILAGALKSNIEDTMLVGETSFGKGLVQKVMYLSDGSIIKITTENWYTPDDEIIHDIGIKPHLEIELTEEDVENNKDTQLEKAIEIINNK